MLAYSLSTSWGLSHYDDLGRFARDAHAWGFSAVEANYGVTLAGLAELSESKVPISSLHYPGPLEMRPGGQPYYAGPLAPADPDQRDLSRQHATRVLHEAAESGARAVVFHAADLPQLRELERGLAQLCRRDVPREERDAARQDLLIARSSHAAALFTEVTRMIESLLPPAEELNVRLGLETRADVRDLPSRTEMDVLLSTYTSLHLGYWHDTGHAHRQELLGFGAAGGWLRAFGSRLIGMHLSDCRGLDDHYPAGQGDVDFSAALAFSQPDTVLTLESAGRHSEAEIRQGLAHLRACETAINGGLQGREKKRPLG